jgi:hypothetical protein
MRGVDVDGFARTIERNARTFYRIS